LHRPTLSSKTAPNIEPPLFAKVGHTRAFWAERIDSGDRDARH
jgi:hypothetical protein